MMLTLFWALCLAASCGGGGGGGLGALTQGPTFTGQIVGAKKTAGEVFKFDRSGDVLHLAYGLTGLVTMNVADLSDIRIVRLTDTVVADAVAACGGLLYVLEYVPPPDNSRLVVFDIGTDPFVPQRLGETTLVVAPGTDLACSGNVAYVAGGTSGLHIIDASDPRRPTLTSLPGGAAVQAIAFHGMHVRGPNLRLVADMGGLPNAPPAPACPTGAPPPAAPDCVASPPVDCFGKFGIRSLDLTDPRAPGCASGWRDVRIPESEELSFPFPTGPNTSPTNHPMAIAEDSGFLYVASTNGRRLTITDKAGAVVFSGNLPGVPQGQISDIDVIGDILVLTDGEVRIIDVSNRSAPFLSSTVFTPGRAFSVRLRATEIPDTFLAYVTDGENGLVVLRISRNFFTPLPARPVAREVPGAGALAFMPIFESTSPLFATLATTSSETTGNQSEGVLADGRILVASTDNFALPVADGTQPGTLLSLDTRGPALLLPNPPAPLAGPFGLLSTGARVYSQNSVCLDALADPLCAAATPIDSDGHFLEFADLATLNGALLAINTVLPSPLLPRFPNGLPPIHLVETGTTLDPTDPGFIPPFPPPLPASFPLPPPPPPPPIGVQTGGFTNSAGGNPARGLAPVASPTAVVAVRDGLIVAGSSGLDVTPTPTRMGTTPPFVLNAVLGRIAVLDEAGRPFAYRRLIDGRPFDPAAYNSALSAGTAQQIADASPFPLFPPVQLRDDAGTLLVDSGGLPLTPDRPAPGVRYGDEEVRNINLLPTTQLPVQLSRTSANPTTIACATSDPDPFTPDPSALPGLDEKTSLGLCHGVFGMAYGGSGNDLSQPNEAATAGFDYYTRNPTYFASTGDGGIVLVDLDSGLSQLSPPGTLVPLVGTPQDAALAWDQCFNPDGTADDPNPLVVGPWICRCDALLSDVGGRLAMFAGTLALAPIECDRYLRMGLTYVPQTGSVATLFAANPLGHAVTAIFVNFEASNTAQGVRYQSGSRDLSVGGLLDTPVDVAPTEPLPVSTSQGTLSSDLYVADRGTGAIVRITQSGEFVSVVEPRVGGRAVGAGRIAALAISPDGNRLYLSLSEGCDIFFGPTSTAGCVLELAAF